MGIVDFTRRDRERKEKKKRKKKGRKSKRKMTRRKRRYRFVAKNGVPPWNEAKRVFGS